ncbi:MAG: FAD-dependent oxidoreductase [Candidatus Saccharimonadales bacterium]
MISNVKLIKKETIADGTMAFYFEKPKDVEFRAGQFADYTLIDPPETDAEGNIRGFSLVQAPYEDYLVAATRMRDTAYKRVLKDMAVGTEVKFDGPYGDFTLHKTLTTPAVFLIGGIGITPVRSMIAQATHDKVDQEITLLYSNRTPELAAFHEDLAGFAAENDKFTYVPVYTEAKMPEWDGDTGYINADIVKKYVPDMNKPIYYISGPATMVAAMRKILVDADVNEDNIRTEEFSGY